MNAEQKEEQISSAAGRVTDSVENDADVLCPAPGTISIGGKTYKIKPLVMKQMYMLQELASANGEDAMANIAQYRELMGMIAEIIGEPSVQFLENNATMMDIAFIIKSVIDMTSRGLQKISGASSKGGGIGGRA